MPDDDPGSQEAHADDDRLYDADRVGAYDLGVAILRRRELQDASIPLGIDALGPG